MTQNKPGDNVTYFEGEGGPSAEWVDALAWWRVTLADGKIGALVIVTSALFDMTVRFPWMLKLYSIVKTSINL